MQNCFIKLIITEKQECQTKKIQHSLQLPSPGLSPQSEKDNGRKKERPLEYHFLPHRHA